MRSGKIVCLSICLFALTSQAFAQQAFVSTEAEYLAAINNPTVTHIVLQSGSDIALTQGSNWITRDIVLEGQLDGNGNVPVLRAGMPWGRALDAGGGAISLKNLAIEDFRAWDMGGAIGKWSNIAGLDNVHFSNNRTVPNGGFGGAFRVEGRPMTGNIIDSSFIGNYAYWHGGGFMVDGLTGNIERSLFANNVVEAHWGGAFATNGHLIGNIIDSQFIENKSGAGGAFLTWGNFFGDITGSVFYGNKAQKFQNSASGPGGAIWTDGWLMGTISNSVFDSNWGTSAGGAIGTNVWTSDIENARFINNRSGYGGGAIFANRVNDCCLGNGKRFIKNSIFVNNQLDKTNAWGGIVGGGALMMGGGFTLTDTVFYNNDADSGWGGALYYYQRADASHDLNILTSAGNKTLFYGNTHRTKTSSSIHFAYRGTSSATHLNIQGAGRTLMLDALSSQNGTQTVVNKMDTGSWYLGGASEMRGGSTWNINDGLLALTRVDYGTGSVADASVNLSHNTTSVFTLDTSARLIGSGSIAAKDITLKGTISPDKWINIGLKAPDIVAATEAITNNVTADVMADSSIADSDKLGIINQRILLQTRALVDVAKFSDIGTLNFSGNVELVAGSNLTLNANPNSALMDRINVTGGLLTIQPGAGVELLNSSNAWALNTPYILIDSEKGVKGEFTNPVYTGFDSYVFADPKLIYTDNQVQLWFLRNSGYFEDICEDDNQCETSGGLDTLPDDDPLSEIVAGLPEDEALAAYDNLSGEIYPSTRAALLDDRYLRNAVNQRLRLPRGRQLWFDTWGHDGVLRGNVRTADLNMRGMGLALGMDRDISSDWLAGAFVAFEDKRLTNAGTRRSRSDVKAYSAGVYAAGQAGGVDLRGAIAWSLLNIDTQRNIAVGSLQGPVSSSHKGAKVQAFVEASKPFAVGNRMTLSPYLNLAQIWLRTDNVRESGNIAALDIARQTDSMRVMTTGIRTAVTLNRQTPTELNFDLGWTQASGATDGQTTNRFVGRGSRFTIKGTDVGKGAALVGAGLYRQLSSDSSIHLDYQGQFGDRIRDHAARMQFRKAF